MQRTLTRSQIVRVIAEQRSRRTITAIAGPPGAGKSTLANWLAVELNERRPGSAAVLQMDGFHYDDGVLEQRGLLARKGAPETFDVGGLASVLERLRRNDEAEVAIPVFDRRIEIARAGASIIGRDVRSILVEGNYLLLKRQPWAGLAQWFDTTVLVRPDTETLRRRLMARWTGAGLSADLAMARVGGNDLVNAEIVLLESCEAQFLVLEPNEDKGQPRFRASRIARVPVR